MTSAKTWLLASSSAPIPGHCEPCPENTHTGLVGFPGSVTPTVTPSISSCPSASARSWAARVSWVPATNAARWDRCERRASSVYARSSSEGLVASSQSASLPAYSATAASLLPDSANILLPSDSAAGSTTGPSGACSRTTCPTVPPYPKLDTAARRTSPRTGHGVSVSTTRKPLVLHGMFGFGSANTAFGGIAAGWRESTPLITPATPAPASRCPMLPLIEPTRHGSSVDRPSPYTELSAAASTG